MFKHMLKVLDNIIEFLNLVLKNSLAVIII